MRARLILIVLWILPSTGHSQDLERRSGRLATTLAAIQPGTAVRVVRADSPTVTGRLGLVGDSAFTLAVDERQLQIRTSEVMALWVHRPSTGRGAAIGALVGGVALFLSPLCQPLRESGCVPPTIFLPLIPAAGLGAAIGGVIGSRRFHWRLTFP